MCVYRCRILSGIATSVTHAMLGYIFPCNFVTSFVGQFLYLRHHVINFLLPSLFYFDLEHFESAAYLRYIWFLGIDYRGFVVHRATLIVCLVQSWTKESSHKNERLLNEKLKPLALMWRHYLFLQMVEPGQQRVQRSTVSRMQQN